MANDEKMESAIRIGISGLWRFYDDGFTRWPRNKLMPLFSNIDLGQPEVQKALESLERQGQIKLKRTTECYLEVLHAPKI